eukprot:COSAG06_NODE_9542_length_1874_cov_26.162817_4_plen_72_part_00
MQSFTRHALALLGFQRLVTTKCSRSGRCGKKKTPLFLEPFLRIEDDQFTKTGSGQTWEMLREQGACVFFLL